MKFVKGRCETFKRSDGVQIQLLPKPYCRLCAYPTPAPYDICYNCDFGETQVDKRHLSRIYAASVYISHLPHSLRHELSEEIVKCKYDIAYTNGLAEVLEYAISEMYPELQSYDFLVPTLRGSKTATTNHVKNIVDELSNLVGIPTRDVLYKKVDYPSQRTLNREGRIENVRDKIGCREHVNGRIIVVDDTYTTGATLLNSAKPLKEMGAEEVVGLVLGRATDVTHLKYVGVLEETNEQNGL